MIYNGPKFYKNIWATFERKFVTKKFKKSPNLVTLFTYQPNVRTLGTYYVEWTVSSISEKWKKSHFLQFLTIHRTLCNVP